MGDAERRTRRATVVARLAHGPDELADVRLRIVVLDRGLVGREVDTRERHAAGARERLPHRRGAARAGHALDGKNDAGLTHGAPGPPPPPPPRPPPRGT